MNPSKTSRDLHALTGIWHEHAKVLITLPLQILAVIVVTLLIRAIVHRSVDRLVEVSSAGKVPRFLSPLKEHARESNIFAASGLLSERRRQRAGTIGSVLKSTTSILLFALGTLVILDLIGLDLAPFIAGTSIVGAAVAFGAQGVIKDFLSGMFMILEDQYGVGDFIDVKEASGIVEAIGLRTTRLRDNEGTVWYVRNGEVVRVGNKSQLFATVVIDVPIDAEDNLEAATQAISGAIESVAADEDWKSCFLEQPEVLGVESLSRGETVLRISAKVRPHEQWRVGRELRARIREAFDTERMRRRTPSEHRD